MNPITTRPTFKAFWTSGVPKCLKMGSKWAHFTRLCTPNGLGSAAWDLFWSASNGPVSGWTHGLSWQHAACLSALLQLYDRAVTALAESPGLGVAARAVPEFTLGSDGQHCSVLVVIGGGQAPAWEGAAVHRWSLARLDAQPEHVHVRVGDRFWVSAPEGTVPQGLAAALIALSAVVPSSSTVVRARGDPDAPPRGSGPAAAE